MVYVMTGYYSIPGLCEGQCCVVTKAIALLITDDRHRRGEVVPTMAPIVIIWPDGEKLSPESTAEKTRSWYTSDLPLPMLRPRGVVCAIGRGEIDRG
jgi:hypothetical protein